jgi:hypothetical protein
VLWHLYSCWPVEAVRLLVSLTKYLGNTMSVPDLLARDEKPNRGPSLHPAVYIM